MRSAPSAAGPGEPHAAEQRRRDPAARQPHRATSPNPTSTASGHATWPNRQRTPPHRSNYFYVIGNPPSTVRTSPTETSIRRRRPTHASHCRRQHRRSDLRPDATAPAPPTADPCRPGDPAGAGPTIDRQSASGRTSRPPTPDRGSHPALRQLPRRGSPCRTAGSAQYYWVCLRRPANPFAPVSATNPMCVVDSMRFPYIEDGYHEHATTDTRRYHVCTPADLQHDLLGPAAPALSRRTRRAVPDVTGTGTLPRRPSRPTRVWLHRADRVPQTLNSRRRSTYGYANIRAGERRRRIDATYHVPHAGIAPTTRPRTGITSCSTTATSPAWPS